MDAYPDPANAPDPTEAVAERIAEMTFAELRDRYDTYRLRRQMTGRRPYGYRFGEWLRDDLAREWLRGDA